jgi:hypothetical protein
MRASAKPFLTVLPLACLAVPGAASAQPTVAVAPALALERSQVCREATGSLDDFVGYAAGHGWTELRRAPGNPATGRSPEFWFERDGVQLYLQQYNAAQADCSIGALMPEGTPWADVLAAATTAFGRAPDDTSGSYARWVGLGNRSVTLRLTGHFFSADIYPVRPTIQAAQSSGRDSEEASTAPSSAAAEIATAATACAAAAATRNVDAGAIRSAGWGSMSERGGVRVFSRDGSNVRIFVAPAGQCVVDAYGERRNSFDAIRDAIRAALTARFGAEAAMGEAIGSPGAFSRGQGYTVGNRIGVLSSEQRDGGLSIRFTVMSFR